MTDESPKLAKPSRKRGVADYPPEFMDIWTLASQGKLELTFDSAGAATNFRQRLHAFRKAWVNENGQASIAHWWNYDLAVIPESVPPEDICSRTPKAVLLCRELDWKKQVREQMHQVQNPQAPVQAPSELIPEGLRKEVEHSIGATNAQVDAVLNKLGFK